MARGSCWFWRVRGAGAVLTAWLQPIFKLPSLRPRLIGPARRLPDHRFIGIPCITAYNIIAPSSAGGLRRFPQPMSFIAVAMRGPIGLGLWFLGGTAHGPRGCRRWVLRWPRASASSFRWGSFCGAKSGHPAAQKVTLFGPARRTNVNGRTSCAFFGVRWRCRTDLSKSRFCSSRSLRPARPDGRRRM